MTQLRCAVCDVELHFSEEPKENTEYVCTLCYVTGAWRTDEEKNYLVTEEFVGQHPSPLEPPDELW